MSQLRSNPSIKVGIRKVSPCRCIHHLVKHELSISLDRINPRAVEESVKVVIHPLDVRLVNDQHFVRAFRNYVLAFEDFPGFVVACEAACWRDTAPVAEQSMPNADVFYVWILLADPADSCIEAFGKAFGVSNEVRPAAYHLAFAFVV